MFETFNYYIMKRTLKLFVFMVAALSATGSLSAQEWSAGADLVSTYVWRGQRLAGTSFQPSVEYSVGGFAIGAWGSYGFDNDGAEADLYTGYTFSLGESASLGISLTDYFFPSIGGALQPGGYFNAHNHTFEPALTVGVGNFSLLGAYAMQSTGEAGNDGATGFYGELGYSFGNLSLAVGAGEGAYSLSTDINVVNISLSYTKELKITHDFTLPVTGSVILNPNTEQFYAVIGISF